MNYIYIIQSYSSGDYCTVAIIPIGSIPVIDSTNKRCNYCLTFTGPQSIDRTNINTGFISTLDIVPMCYYQIIKLNINHSLVTNENGKYTLKDQVPGSYCIQMVISPYCKHVAQQFDSNVKYTSKKKGISKKDKETATKAAILTTETTPTTNNQQPTTNNQ
ncbi:hypothetical protein ACTFIZ_006966 [Dictyostelium cf. discoideum]